MKVAAAFCCTPTLCHQSTAGRRGGDSRRAPFAAYPPAAGRWPRNPPPAAGKDTCVGVPGAAAAVGRSQKVHRSTRFAAVAGLGPVREEPSPQRGGHPLADPRRRKSCRGKKSVDNARSTVFFPPRPGAGGLCSLERRWPVCLKPGTFFSLYVVCKPETCTFERRLGRSREGTEK